MPTKTRRPQAPKPRYAAEHLRHAQELHHHSPAVRPLNRPARPTERRRALLEQEA